MGGGQDAEKHPVIHRTVPATKNYPVQMTSLVKVEKPSSGLLRMSFQAVSKTPHEKPHRTLKGPRHLVLGRVTSILSRPRIEARL